MSNASDNIPTFNYAFVNVTGASSPSTGESMPIFSDMEELFRKWMSKQTSQRGTTYTQQTIDDYCKAVTEWLEDPVFSALQTHTVFVFTESLEYTTYKQEVESQPDYQAFNNAAIHGPQRLHAAMELYQRFLDDEQVKKAIKVIKFISPYLAAIRTKPFLLLAGISGTGKSRMVRQLARGCCPKKDGGGAHPLVDEQKPGNFEMIQVRPNWHDSTELMGYVTRMGTKPEYVMTPFVEFLAKAWLFPKVPFFLCLDEMNLAPVEQYFAEYLSVIETRRLCDDGDIMTDPLVRFDVAKLDDSETGLAKFVNQCVETLLKKYWTEAAWQGKVDPARVQEIKEMFLKDSGIRIPKNLVVIGTVNMDETTFSFSRKVLDRAMSFELTDVEPMYTVQPADKIEWEALLGQAEQRYVSAEDLYFRAPDPDTAAKNKEMGEKVLASIKKINDFLDDTPFKIAYRSRNEIMLYCIERTACALSMLPKALDEAISMKILSRVEGDEQRLSAAWLEDLSKIIADQINDATCTICSKKIEEMQKQLGRGYASFWTR